MAYTFLQTFGPDKLVRNKIFSNLDFHPCSMRRSATLAGGGLERIYSVIAGSMFYLIRSSSPWPKGDCKLRWCCILINNPKELFRVPLGLIMTCKYADGPLLLLVWVPVQEGEASSETLYPRRPLISPFKVRVSLLQATCDSQ